jgi:hypothetical protein
MYAGTDATMPMTNPSRDVGVSWAWYFVTFILVGSFFIINLCVGVIVDNFGQMKEEAEEAGEAPSIMLTKAQAEANVKLLEAQQALSVQRVFFGLTNLHTLPPLRRKAFKITSHELFEKGIMACIILNTVVMGMKIFPAEDVDRAANEGLEDVFVVVNHVFAGIFITEAILKLFAMRMDYFTDKWNCFDFFCVVVSIVGIVVASLPDAGDNAAVAEALRTFRMFRIARLLRLVRFAKGLNKLFNALLLSIPKLMNVSMILVLMLFLFSVMGVNMFARTHEYGQNNVHANFHTPWMAGLTLIRSMTGEGWNEIMHSLAKPSQFFGHTMGQPCVTDMDVSTTTVLEYKSLEDRCLIEKPVQCGSPFMAIIFFVAYTCLITFVILNLFVAVVLEGFDDSSVGDSEAILERCVSLWKKPQYDPDLNMKMPWLKASEFVSEALALGSANRVQGGKEGAKRKLAVQEAEVSRLEIDADFNVSFQSAALAVIRLSCSKEELAGVLKLEKAKGDTPDLLAEGDPRDIRGQVAALALQAAFKKRQAYKAQERKRSEEEMEQAKNGRVRLESATDGLTVESLGDTGQLDGLLQPGCLPKELVREDPTSAKHSELEEKDGEPDAAG